MITTDPRIHVSLAHLKSLGGASRGLNFLPRQPSASVLNGRHSSRLRGRGLNFEEMRNYLPGDDVRSIDWKATARTGKPHVRVFTEERDRPALLVIDQRMSMFFGSQRNMKSVTAAEAAAIAAFRILDVGDRVGGIVFNDDRRIEIKPRRSSRGLYSMLESLASMNGELHADREVDPKPGSLNDVLGATARIAHHDHLVIIFSDFDGIDATTRQRLSGIAAHNDLVLILVTDPTAQGVEGSDRLVIGDRQRQAELDLGVNEVREALRKFRGDRLDRILGWQSEINISVLPLSAGEETLPQVRRLLSRQVPQRRVR